jgi:hypothetical protein
VCLFRSEQYAIKWYCSLNDISFYPTPNSECKNLDYVCRVCLFFWLFLNFVADIRMLLALLVPSCCNKCGTSCYHFVTRLMTVTDFVQAVPTRLIQDVRNKLLQACCHQIITTCYTCRRYQTCCNNLLRVCWPHQRCYKMITYEQTS